MPVKKSRNPILEAARQATTDEAKAVEFLEAQRWPNGPECPKCASSDVYKMMKRGTTERQENYRLRCCGCKQQFTVRTGTVMEDSPIPLRHWVLAMWVFAAGKKGCAAKQIERMTGLSYKSALFMAHRLRLTMADNGAEALLGTVEVDETYVGGKPRRMSKQQRERLIAEGKPLPHNKRGAGTDKVPVVAMVSRENGRVWVSPAATVTAETLRGAIRENVHRSSRIVTDESRVYTGIGKDFAGGHYTTTHSEREYARTEEDGSVTHSNTAESFFAVFKRGIHGIYHHVSPRHLHRYCDEFAFRWSTRRMDDAERLVAAIRNGEGRRLLARNSTPVA